MSLINSVHRVDRGQEAEAVVSSDEDNDFLSIYQRFGEKVTRLAESQKKMDMVYNYMVKNDIQTERKSDQKEEKVRKTRKDKEGRKYICGACKLGYLSYPALYTHIKTKHKGQTPEGTIRGESGKPKKRGRPKVRKTPQIYERELQKNEFPKQLSGLVLKESLELLQLDDIVEPGEQQQTEIMHKYFVGIVRDLKKMAAARIYLLPIAQVVTTFLENIKDYVGEQTMTEIEDTLFQFLGYVNRRHSHILTDYQTLTKYYIDAFLPPDQVYCEVERPYFLPVFAQKFLRTQLTAEDELKQTLMLDFCKWLFTQQLTDIKLLKDGSASAVPRE